MNGWAVRTLAAAGLVTACAFQSPVGPGGVADGGPGIDAAGTADAMIDAAPIPCDAGAATCDENEVVACVDGLVQRTACSLGCTTTGFAHCAQVAASNGVTSASLDGAIGVIDVPAGATWVLDSNTGAIVDCSGNVYRPVGTGLLADMSFAVVDTGEGVQKDLGVLGVRSLTVQAGATLRVVGQNSVAFDIAEEARIAGTLDISGGARACTVITACGSAAAAYCGGPGGFDGGQNPATGNGTSGQGGSLGGQGGQGNSGPEGGGGGGGHGFVGGRGGGSTGGAASGTTTDMDIEPIFGGGGGGEGGSGPAGLSGPGGGGGGAVQISARVAIRVPVGGVILAAGSGGRGGDDTATYAGGGGGGAGGAILLESPVVELLGVAAANGGGGGGGNCNIFDGADGQPGGANATGSAGGADECAGGVGGSAAEGAGARGLPVTDIDRDGSGGGGGGAGRVYVRVRPAGQTLTGVISPLPVVGDLRTE